MDAVLNPARTSSPEPSAKSSLSADLGAERLRRVWIEGRRTLVTEAPTPVTSPDGDPEPEIILERLLLKAEAPHLAAEREQRLPLGSDFEPEIAALLNPVINRAKAPPDCYLWMVHPSKTPAAAPEVFEVLAHCFTNTAMALELSNALETPAELKHRSLEVLAEAQSALRAQAAVLGGGRGERSTRCISLVARVDAREKNLSTRPYAQGRSCESSGLGRLAPEDRGALCSVPRKDRFAEAETETFGKDPSQMRSAQRGSRLRE